MEITTGAVIFGISTALLIIWLSLRKYSGFYSDKTLFKSLVIGFILGFTASLIESLTYEVGFLFLILFPFVEQFLKFLGINLPSYQGRKDSIIYGLVMGLGFGSIFAPLLIVVAFKSLKPNLLMMVVSLLLGAGYILFHGGTGCMLGYGIYKGEEKWRFLAYSIALGFPFTAMESIDILIEEIGLIIAIRLVEVVYALLIFLTVQKKMLPFSLPRSRRKDLNPL